jgi:hypothetical protein
MAASKQVLLMLMIASLASGVLAVPLALFVGGGQMLVVAIPGFVVGAFFAFKYATYDKSKRKQEEHRRNRTRRKH